MASRNHALFIHGLGSDSSTCLPSQRLLDEVNWIIPDLAGHGMSCKPLDFEPYTMKSQADSIHQILSEQGVKNVFIIGHSLGGPIAIELCEKIIRENRDITLNGLIYEEGNINEDDCFGSKKILEKGCPKVSPHSDEKEAMDFAMYASSKDLVEISCSGELLPRIKALKDGGLPMMVMYGEKNFGRFSSATLLEQSGFKIVWVAKGGHSMHKDEGSGAFWAKVEDFILSNISRNQ
ncbi:hypothetical protein GUITHDRAFT_109399 [Guillardia theta CCMP2712]|uniref:AB hydrolase-1 domain-containing protein n=2 Tax=Guillardia theta TaxID=55529 RepID=L1J7W1_GUITC|nr:hypothetical protein GUITHDRAFT_109399 [Guillardia theta CCMP2712]EKX44623.1 hypothetical protein GUITHDRAFT_109399 [Guillardia theta CCMP2712]|eukprot:XP_005831603.1 hypothetical protein GUITHDRAFT_109399 [Guillardia theta CCMP2712]